MPGGAVGQEACRCPEVHALATAQRVECQEYFSWSEPLAKSKLYPSAASALDGVVADNQTLAVGGFGLCGIPEELIAGLRDSGVQGLPVISHNAGLAGFDLCPLLGTSPSKTIITPYVSE